MPSLGSVAGSNLVSIKAMKVIIDQPPLPLCSKDSWGDFIIQGYFRLRDLASGYRNAQSIYGVTRKKPEIIVRSY